MKRYRIITGSAYSGCRPITVYWVQVRKDGFFCDTWENIKGFEDYKKAQELLDLLDK